MACDKFVPDAEYKDVCGHCFEDAEAHIKVSKLDLLRQIAELKAYILDLLNEIEELKAYINGRIAKEESES